MNKLITAQDLFIVPFLLVIIYFIAYSIKRKKIDEFPFYKYFIAGLSIKILGGFLFSAIYLFHYGGGDTVHYFTGSGSIVKMLGEDLSTFFKLLRGDNSEEIYSMFNRTTGWPLYFKDSNSFSVCRFNVLFYILSFGSYLGNTIVLNVFLFWGSWQFFKVLQKLYPHNEKGIAIALFFLPSVAFWSSGILKDGWTLTTIYLSFTSFYYILIDKRKVIFNIIILIVSLYIIFSIRPFVFYLTICSCLAWIGFSSIARIKNSVLKVILLPFIFILFISLGGIIIAQSSKMATKRYTDLDTMLEYAWIIQDDLSRDYYGENSFDIGDFEPTLTGVLKMAPKAVIAGIFRPFIWEANNALMLFSSIENLCLLLISIYVIIKARVLKFFRILYHDPLLLTFFSFSIIFAFMVGLTTANFGALVRYRIPVIPFLLIALVVIHHKNKLNNQHTIH